MSEMSFDTSNSDGHLSGNDETYLTAQAQASADSGGSASSYKITVGQQHIGGTTYQIWRGFLFFDTSALPDDAVIISAKLQLYIETDSSDTDFNIVIRRNAAQTYPTDPIDNADFDIDFYVGDGGSINTSGFGSGWNDIPLNPTGLGWIDVAGTLKLALISSEDLNKSQPAASGKEYVAFHNAEYASGAVKPRLVVTYTAEKYPTVTTQAATNVGKTYCTANGTLTDGGIATEWGAEYGLTETPTWITKQTGRIGEQTFLTGISGLEPSTTYYYRAYATNSYGTAYGDWVIFTTGTAITYGLYEEDNTATICFYLSEDDGRTWGQKHGPYTTDQADIEVTKLLVRGSGKKKIKFETTALTGISASVMVKLDCKAR